MAKDRVRLQDLDQSKSLDQDESKKVLKKHQLQLLNAQPRSDTTAAMRKIADRRS